MKIEVYIPEYELELIGKCLDLKAKRKLSSTVVELLRGTNQITREEIIKLIEQHIVERGTENKNTANDIDIVDSINSVLGSAIK